MSKDVEVGRLADDHADRLEARSRGGHLVRVARVALHVHGEGRLGNLVADELDNNPVLTLRGRRVGAAVRQVTVVVELGVDLRRPEFRGLKSFHFICSDSHLLRTTAAWRIRMSPVRYQSHPIAFSQKRYWR